MAEDLAFSVVLFSFANTFEYVETDLIFYTQRKDASTSAKMSFPKLKKNINDLSKVFKFAERFLISNKFNQYLEDLKEWKKLYSRFWFDSIEQGKVNYIFKNKLKKLLLNSLELKDIEGSKVYDHYHYNVRSKWYDYGESLKKEIISDESRIISFDIFDTLIERPFLNPHTLFDFLEIEFSYKDKRFAGGWFKKLRIESEKEVREEIWRNGLSIEEVTLDQIYDEIAKRGISKELSEKIKEKEIELELKYCRKRNYAKELYELAIYKNKKTVVTSDMYLPKSVISQILEKNGYSHINDIFLSADIGLTKSTGNLFKYALKKLKISPKNFMHIGDNWESDVQSAKNQKIRWHVLFPKASDLLFNNLRDHYGDSLKGLKEFSGRWINYLYLEHSLILNCCLGLIANKYFQIHIALSVFGQI